MRFLVAPARSALGARAPVRLFLVFAALLLAGLVLQRASGPGLWPAAATEPLPATALWEELHAFAFLWGFLILMLGSLLVASPVSDRVRGVLTYGSGAAALVELGAAFVPALSPVRAVAFGCTIGLLGAAVAVAFFRFGRR